MFHVDNNSAVPVMPAIKPVISATPSYFTEGGNGIPPTYPGPDWFNIVQSELLAILAAAGINPDKANNAQLLAAMKLLFLDASQNGADIQDKTLFLQNLRLGEAAKRGVWGGGGNVTAAGGFSLGVPGAFALPTGTIVQWDEGVTASGGFTKNYPIPFPNQCLALVPVVYSGLGAAYSVLANKASRVQANFNVVNTSGSGVSGISVGYIAIGY